MEANPVEMSKERHNQNVRKYLGSSSSCMIRIVGVRSK